MKTSTARRVSLLTMAAAALLATSVTPLMAQDCLQWVPPLLHDSSGNPDAVPSNPRIFGTDVMSWNGTPYLLANQGNNLDMWRISDPQNPGPKSESYFRAGYLGDRDYNLFNFSVCDDCQFGVASFEQLGAVLFSFGTGQTPGFQANPVQYPSAQSFGAFTFKHNGQQYLLINGMPNGDKGTPAPANLFLFNGLDTSQITRIGRVDAGGTVITVLGGVYVNSGSGAFVYVFDKAFHGHIFKLVGTGANLSLQYMGSPFIAGYIRSIGFRVDASGSYAAAVFGTNAAIYDISIPDQPAVLKQWTPDPDNAMASVAIGYPFLWMGRTGFKVSRTYDISNPTAPISLDQGFWDPANDWNDYGSLYDTDSVFSPDASTLYDGRYSVLEMISFSACGDITPVANLSISPQPAFPGDTVTVTNTSAGGWTRSAIWITLGADPQGEIVAGSPVLSAETPAQLPYSLAAELGLDQSYTAHVAVENDDHPYNPGAPGDQLKNVTIGIDRAPTATIGISPEAVLTGDAVILAADAQGHPTSWNWHISPPAGNPFDLTGQSTEVTLSQSGTWTFDLTVHYPHLAATGGLYQYSTEKSFFVTSVAADFTVTPATPLNTQPITLDASPSLPPTGVTLGYDWNVAGATSYTGCPAAKVCVIPGDALNPGQYQITLTLTNLDNGTDQSVAVQNINVADGNNNPDFTWNPPSPEIGSFVYFDISGISGNLESATWNFGGSGCSGFPQQVTCVADYVSCLRQPHKYASGGTKTVSLSVKVDGQTYQATPKTITVQNTGTCGGTSCSYRLTSTKSAFDASGGTGTINVNTTAGCTWSASKTGSWISFTGNTSGSGSGSIPFSVAANSGSARSGQIAAGGDSVTITQGGVGGSADFSISNTNPEIGELVTVTVVGSSTPESWNFGSVNCDGVAPTISCFYNPNLCRQLTWRYQTAGAKTITYTDDTNNEVSKTITVKSTGSCPAVCDATAAPPSTFSLSTNSALVGEGITFAYTGPVAASALDGVPIGDAKAQTLALDFSAVPLSPRIGQVVTFRLTGLSGGISSATWNFGGPGCGDYTQQGTCTAVPGVIGGDCTAQPYKFSSAGDKTVSVTVHYSSGGSASASQTITVQNTGTCDGGTTCSYSISPSNASFGPEGGSGSVTVTSQEGCTWTAVSNDPSWISVTAGATGSGSGQVAYSVGVNSGAARDGTLKIASRFFNVNQAADSSQSTDGADAWEWTIKRGSTVVETSDSPVFTLAFDEPGDYTATLKVSNCKGSSTKTVNFIITQINDYVVPAVAHAGGQNDTTWKTDLRLFNPATVKITVTLDFLEEARQNLGVIPGVTFDLPPKGTMVIDDVLTVIPGIPVGSSKGALRFAFEGGGGNVPVIMSRTYNDTPNGTYGQYVPAVPVLPGEGGALYLTGMADNDQYRSNLGVANLSGRDIGGLTATVLDAAGNELGSYGIGVPAYSTIQVVNIARAAGVTAGNLDLFSVRLDTNGADVTAYASVIDNRTGDPVLYTPAVPKGNRIYLLGVAHLKGLNGSQWRSDVTLLNRETSTNEVRLEYFPDEASVFRSHLTVPLPAHSAQSFGDILTSMVSDQDTKGYLVLDVTGDNVEPQVTARTYNQAEDGTYGQNVPVFSADQLIPEGGMGLLPGVSNSAVSTDGFRTNLGLLNTSETEPAQVDVTIYDEGGEVVGKIPGYPLEPGQYVQFDVFKGVQLGAFDMDASIELKVLSGGPVAAYVSSIDNRTGDPIFIPALIGR
jgi:hypothetical protein